MTFCSADWQKLQMSLRETLVPDYIAARLRQHPPRDVPIIRLSTPVVSFGDVRQAKIATLGLNPSKYEFVDRRGQLLEGERRRLETVASLKGSGLRVGSRPAVHRIFAGCNEYFHRRPLGFFGVLERVLKRIGKSYYNGSACHLDLSQWATPLWKDLTVLEQEKLLNADAHFLRKQLAHEHIRLLLLCGTTVMEKYREHSPDVLPSEPFLTSGRIRMYKGRTSQGLVVVGWNLFLQRGGDVNVIGSTLRKIWQNPSSKHRV